MAYTAAAVLAKERSQLGVGESPPGSNHNKYTQWYGLTGAWCDMFQVWSAYQVGGLDAVAKCGRFAYTPWHAQWHKDRGRFDRTPKVGSHVFYDWAGSRSIAAIDHIEIVEQINGDGTFYALGGNVSDKVTRTRRSMAYVVGFGHPEYDPDTPTQEDDVPYRTSVGKTKAQDIPWDKATWINWDAEYADSAHAHWNGNHPGYVSPAATWADFNVSLRVDGLQVGDYWQVAYYVYDDKAGKAVGDPWSEVAADFPATTGRQYMVGSSSKGLAKGQHVYVAATVFPAGGDAKARPVPKAVSGRWTIRQDRA